MYMLESLKNSLTGKVHMPHSYFIDYGVHAITFEGVSAAAKTKETSTTDMHKVKNMLAFFEMIHRGFDMLDEQLHAGYFFYILTSNLTFVSNSVFLYPVITILVSFILQAGIDYFEYLERE